MLLIKKDTILYKNVDTSKENIMHNNDEHEKIYDINVPGCCDGASKNTEIVTFGKNERVEVSISLENGLFTATVDKRRADYRVQALSMVELEDALNVEIPNYRIINHDGYVALKTKYARL